MTLILKLDLDMVKMYLYTKMKFLCQRVKSYNLNRQKHRQKHRQTHRQTHSHDQKHYLPAYAGGNQSLIAMTAHSAAQSSAQTFIQNAILFIDTSINA